MRDSSQLVIGNVRLNTVEFAERERDLIRTIQQIRTVQK